MEFFEILNSTKLFNSMTEFDCQAMMFCLKTRFKTFDKNQKIISQGDPMEEIVLLLKGGARVENIDVFGDISILTRLKKGEVYGVESAYADDEFYHDSVIATEKTFVMFMNKHRAITPCANKCKRHEIFVKKLMQQVAESSIDLLEKLNHMSKKTIRDKLLSYFAQQARKIKSTYFEIPFNKTELANYLSVDRSAMSNELSKLKKEGVIDFEKRQFHIIKQQITFD